MEAPPPPVSCKLELEDQDVVYLSSTDDCTESDDSSYRPSSSMSDDEDKIYHDDDDDDDDNDDDYEGHVRTSQVNRERKNDLVCCICKRPSQVKENLGLLLCGNCHQFFVRAAMHNFSYECTNGGRCTIIWRPGRSIGCRGCRLKKIIEHPDFRHEHDADGNPVRDELIVPGKFTPWLYNDLKGFLPGSLIPKKPTDEVQPKWVKTNNQIEDLQFSFLTSRLKFEEDSPPPEIEEFSTPVLETTPSFALLKSHAMASDHSYHLSSSQIVFRDDSQKETHQLLLNIKLKTFRTIIDRRPMLKRSEMVTSSNTSSMSTENKYSASTSLIEPGEDCDESDDDNGVIIEIDCDNM